MGNHFLSYWKPDTAHLNLDRCNLLDWAASNQYGRIREGDTLWIVTAWRGGHLVLLGRLQVGKVTDQETAAQEPGVDRSDMWEAQFYAFAKSGIAEPLREIPIGDIAADLRFQSARDHLTIIDDRVNADQLQTMRLLTPDSARLLERCWSADSDLEEVIADTMTRDRPTTAGFGKAASNREVEQAAVLAVTELYRNSGWMVRSVEQDRIGYDLLCTRDDEVAHVEVKGVRSTLPNFIITENEFRRAAEDPQFELCIVLNTLSSDQCIVRCAGSAIVDDSRCKIIPIAYRACLLDQSDFAG